LSSNLVFVSLAHNTSEADVNKTLGPFLTLAQNATAGTTQFYFTTHKSLHQWFSSIFNPATDQSAGHRYELGSRLLPREVAETDSENVADTLLSLDSPVGIKYVLENISYSGLMILLQLHRRWIQTRRGFTRPGAKQ